MRHHYLWIDNQPLSLFANEKDPCYFEERALLSANTGDMVILDYKIEMEYVTELNTLLNRRVQVLCIDCKSYDLVESIIQWKYFELLKKYLISNNFIIRSYIPDERIYLLGKLIGCHVLGYEMYIENKTQTSLNGLRSKLGLNQINTLTIANSNSEEILVFFQENKELLCKPDLSIGGERIRSIKNPDEILKGDENTLNGFILQEKLSIELEGSIQFIYMPRTFRIHVCQTFNPFNHYAGFSYPFTTVFSRQLEEDGNKILHYMVSKYGNNVDSFGVDFIVSDNKIYYHDLNPRKTAVTYVMTFIENLCKELRTPIKPNIICKYIHVIGNLNRAYVNKILLKHNIKLTISQGYEGLMIINPSTIPNGLLQVISLSISNKEKHYIKKAEQILDEEGLIEK